MDLVLDIGNFRIKGAFFLGDEIAKVFVIPPEKEPLRKLLEGAKIDYLLISSVNDAGNEIVKELFTELKLPFHLLDFSTVKVELDVDEPEAVGHDRIANVYGALALFPQDDCIVVDLGTAVTFDYVGSMGIYHGGAIYPGLEISAKALNAYTEKLPIITPAVLEHSVAKTTETHIQSGLYWGLLGAIERITFEMRSYSKNPSNIKVIATGGLFREFFEESFIEAINELIDHIDPNLTLVGLHEILKEQREHYQV